MPNTTFKGYSVPTTGTEEDTWGDDINLNSFGVIDKNVGGIVAKTLSNSNVTLSSSESQMLILRLNGTLTGNVQITTLCQGITWIENLTSGAFVVTFTNGVGTPVSIDQGFRVAVLTDATNGPRVSAASSSFASGTAMLFFNAAAPSGWTKSVAHDNKALRVVSGSGGGSGGSTAFTSVFTARTLSVANLPSHSHGVTDPGHTHSYSASNSTWVRDPDTSVTPRANPATAKTTGSSTTGITIQNTGSGTAIDFAVQYIDIICCTKD